MFSTPLILLASLALAGTSYAAPGSALTVAERAAEVCYATETSDLLCYNEPDGDPQQVDVADVAFIAAYLRSYGAQTRLGRLYNQAAADAPDCAEWTVYAHGTALALAKHVNSTVGNTSTLFADIANTIDGGAGATADQIANSILGCGTSGGSFGVVANLSAPAYTASTYPAGYSPNGLLIKIVNSGA
ncbi:hypothetical protein F5Y19DRAFT_458392 [Xylariaceae sp. FL1651]|nr:hypothetical protein F5Y19DRAFT_458392 [Xylariaceae sp. FL1651]